ncbi:hypothetical protein BS47DRAFT_1398328 [Hydnum rufescens UP504]|uniref:Uncharacterized protein n=1 Tax=Hydnum rufescens UP504 TaxID=1448309 RepID=A0A9P6AL72_9AGAM|nr:hypothetical protein BS47DRAFT_1398328 [Hydnum rufescens UP504]
MTRSQTTVRGKTIFLSSDGCILCDCPGDLAALHRYSGLSPKTLAEDFGDVPSGETTSTDQPNLHLTTPKTPTHVSQITSTPLTPTRHPATQSLNLQLALNEAEREALESALREAIDNNNRLMQENIELKQTVEALNCRIERIPDVAKAAIIEFLSMEI